MFPTKKKTTKVLISPSPSRNYILQSRAEICFPQPSFITSNSYKVSSQVEFISLTAKVHSPTEFISLQRQNLPIKHLPPHNLFSSRVNPRKNILKQEEEIPGKLYPSIIPSENEGFSLFVLFSSSSGFTFPD